MSILEKIETSFKNKLPFVAYRKPNEEKVTAFFQRTNALFFTENYTESGFIFAPFDDANPSVLIPESESEFLKEKIIIDKKIISETIFPSDEVSKENHIELVEKGITAIHKNQFKKVVLSRKETVELLDLNLINKFSKLILSYKESFVYVFYHPKIGLWLGATPETLLNINENQFETMALAGTQLYNEASNVVWLQKEIDEQQFVTDYIVQKLKAVSDTVSVSKTETAKAGNLLHLKTKISGTLKPASNKIEDKNLKLIEALHPTPAVCGLPKSAAKNFILENENYNRSFYTGFLGELNLDAKKTSLFVNLRCMEIENNNAHIYIGGGITKDSNSLKEWEETIAKTKTMKRVL